MENIISFIKYLAMSNTINFLLMVCLLFWIFKKFNINNLFIAGIKSVESKISESENQKDDASKKFYDVRVEMEHLPEKLADMNKEAIASAKDICISIDKDADVSVEGVRANINKTLLNEEKRLSSEISEGTVLKVVDKVKDKIKLSIKDNAQIRDSLIEQSLRELEGVKL